MLLIAEPPVLNSRPFGVPTSETSVLNVVDRLENAPEAFIGLLEGRNFGNLIVRIALSGLKLQPQNENGGKPCLKTKLQ
jgi:hypothetical protein